MGNERLLTICLNRDGSVAFGGNEQLTHMEMLEIALTMIVATDADVRKEGTEPGAVRGLMLEQLQREERYEEMVAGMMEELDADG